MLSDIRRPISDIQVVRLEDSANPTVPGVSALNSLRQHLVGGGAQLDGTNIIISTIVMNINHECTGIFVLVIYAAFLLAYLCGSWFTAPGNNSFTSGGV